MSDDATRNARFDDVPFKLVQSIAAARQYGTYALGVGQGDVARREYAAGGLMARIVDIPADGAVRRGLMIEGGGAEVMAEIDRLRMLPALGDALRWARLSGGGAVVVITEDAGGGDLLQPLDPARLMRIRELRTVSIDDMQAGDSLVRDTDSENYGRPETYKIRFTSGGQQVSVHESRVIEVPGDPLPSSTVQLDVSRIPWRGRGVGLPLVAAVQRYRTLLDWSGAIVERKQTPVHRMTRLADMLMAGQEEVVRQRIRLIDANRNLMTTVAVDADDDYSVLDASLDGVQEVLQEAQVAVSAEAGLPVTVLFGRSPAGLNSTGDGDWAIVHSLIENLQSSRLTPAAERLVSLIYAQTNPVASGMRRPDEWTIVWNGLAVLNDVQNADVENKRADTALKVANALKILIDVGAVSEEEGHDYIRSIGAYGLEADDTGAGTGTAQTYAATT